MKAKSKGTKDHGLWLIQILLGAFTTVHVLIIFYTFICVTQQQLRANLEANKKLAHEYRVIQNDLYRVKNELLDTFEHRVGLESSLKDHKQVSYSFICGKIDLYFGSRGERP